MRSIVAERVATASASYRIENPPKSRKKEKTLSFLSLFWGKNQQNQIYPYPLVWPLPRPWSETMVSIPLWALQTLCIKGFLSLARPFWIWSRRTRAQGVGVDAHLLKKGKKTTEKTRIFYSGRTPTMPGKEGKDAQRNKELLEGEKTRNSKKTRKGRTWNWKNIRNSHFGLIWLLLSYSLPIVSLIYWISGFFYSVAGRGGRNQRTVPY